MNDPMHELDQILSRELLDQVIRDSYRQWPADPTIEWGTIDDLDAAAWDDLTRALKDKDRDRDGDLLG
jgi:hypothetical protein